MAIDHSRENHFGHGALDRRSDLRKDGARLAELFAAPQRRMLLMAGDQIVLADGGPRSLVHTRLSAGEIAYDGSLFLGLDDAGAPWFAALVDPVPAGREVADLRSLALEGLVDGAEFGPAAQARSMLNWHASHGFCARCGQPTVMAAGGYQRDCPACGAQHFPRTDPVVIMLVHDGDRLLLGRQARFRAGSYSCLAGFMEPGETVEDAVRREVREEAGITVGAVGYHSSQPWPFPSNLMLGCLGEANSRDIVVDRDELEDCRWFGRAEVAQMLAGSHPDGLTCPPRIAIARTLIEAWMQPSG